ncbi:MAG: hypothetical protein ACFB9M_05810 [Myxococcota bacterium]
MEAEDRHLERTETPHLPGLDSRRWSVEGAALGLAATGGISAAVATLAGLESGVGMAALLAAVISGPAAILGAGFGLRWKRWVRRDSGRVTVARWLRRLAGDGAVVAGASAAGSATLLLTYQGLGWAEIAKAAGASALVAAPAGALMLAALGLPFLLSLSRGRRPWLALTLSVFAGPPSLALVLLALWTLGAVLG